MLRRLPLLLALLALILLAADGVRVGLAVRDLQRAATELQDGSRSLGQDPARWTPDRLAQARQAQRQALSRARGGRAVLAGDPLISAAALLPLPVVHDQAVAARDLADALEAGAEAFGDLIEVAQAYADARDGQGPAGPRLLKLSAAVQPRLESAVARLEGPAAALRRDQSRPLAPPLATAVSRALRTVEPARQQAELSAETGRQLPALLGADRPRTYLVLLANPSEMRPAGGFYGVVGTMRVAQGVPTLDLHAQSYYNQKAREHFEVPYPVGRYLRFAHDSLELGDSGWDPDFPSTAALAERMYASATGQRVDGTISLDPYLMAALLAITGPVDVKGYGTFQAADFFPRLNYIVNAATGPGTGQDALAPIAQSVLERIVSQPVTRWPRLVETVSQQAGSRHVQAAFHDPSLARPAASQHYDGAIQNCPEGQDCLLVADGNVAGNKADYYLRKSMEVRAELPQSGLSRHEVTLAYEYPNPVDQTDRLLNPRDGAYRDYVRFYLPETATIAALRLDVDGTARDVGLDRISTEHGRKVVGVFFIAPRGHTLHLSLFYQVPVSTSSGYKLLIQKQAGAPARPTTVLASYPGGKARRGLALDRDGEVLLRW